MNRYQWLITLFSWLFSLAVVLWIFRQNTKINDIQKKLDHQQSVLGFYQRLNADDTFGLIRDLDSFFVDRKPNSEEMDHYQILTKYLNSYNTPSESENSTNPDIENMNAADSSFTSMQARINAIKELYSSLLDKNLHLTDSLLKLQGMIEEYPVLKETMSAVQHATEQMKESVQNNHWKTITFKSPSGVDVKYIGEVNKNEKPDGFGVAIYANGNQYEGQWKNGNKDGQGKFVYHDGELYEGSFVRGKRNGYGVYKWKNGESYTGYWQDDLRSGKGIFTTKRGKVISSGIWKADKLVKSENLNKDQLWDSKQSESLPMN